MILIKHHSYYRRSKTKYRWRSVDAVLTLIFRMWLGAWVSVFCTSRRLICRKWTVTYQCQYFTISSSISEYDHKCETQNAEPEIGPDGSSQTRRNPRVDGYGSGFGPPRVSGSGFGRVWNRTDPFLQSKPGPLAGYPDPLLTLAAPAPTTFGEVMECLDSILRSSQMRQITSQPGCSHIRLDSGNTQPDYGIAGFAPAMEAHSSPIQNSKPVEPASFYPCR